MSRYSRSSAASPSVGDRLSGAQAPSSYFDELFEELPATFARMTHRWLQDMHMLSPFGRSHLSMGDMVRVKTDMHTLPDAYVIRADLPGLSKEDVRIDLDTEHNCLTLSGERKYQRHNESGSTDGSAPKTYYRECQYGTFTRRFDLPPDADLEKENAIQASMKNGVLDIRIARMPPSAAASPSKRTIAIQ